LRNTLQSWRNVDPALFSERFVFCQEFDERETDCAQEFGYTVAGSPVNLGIQGGFKAMATHGSSQHLMLLENDCVLTRSPTSAADQINIAQQALSTGTIVTMKLECMRYPPDDAWQTSGRFRRYWGCPEPDTLRQRFRRVLRPSEARSVTGYSIAACEQPELYFPHAVTRRTEGWFQTSSRFLPWSNRSIMVNKSWFLGQLLPFADAHPASHQVNGKDDLEVPVNCPANRHWWRNQNFPIGWLSPGITIHQRLDRDPSDEKLT